MTSNGAGHVDATPTPDPAETTLRRTGQGRFALVSGLGAYVEASAETFVEVER